MQLRLQNQHITHSEMGFHNSLKLENCLMKPLTNERVNVTLTKQVIATYIASFSATRASIITQTSAHRSLTLLIVISRQYLYS